MSDVLTARMDELETRLAFQDDTIEALNEVVSRQEMALEKLQRSLELLARRQADLAASIPEGAEDDQPPPHY
jgi:SlyX protein